LRFLSGSRFGPNFSMKSDGSVPHSIFEGLIKGSNICMLLIFVNKIKVFNNLI